MSLLTLETSLQHGVVPIGEATHDVEAEDVLSNPVIHLGSNKEVARARRGKKIGGVGRAGVAF